MVEPLAINGEVSKIRWEGIKCAIPFAKYFQHFKCG